MPAHYFSFTSLSLLSFTLLAHSSPLDHGPKSQSGAQIVNNATLDSSYARQEIKSVLLKYARSKQYLAGVGINPDKHPEAGYPAFNRNLTALEPTTPLRVGQSHFPLKDYFDDILDVLYYGSIQVGNPAQSLDVDIDTGSADLWLAANCPHCYSSQLQPDESSTFTGLRDRCSLSYGMGHVSGILAQDTVAVGGGLVVKGQSFCAAHKVSDEFDREPISGLLGLAFGTISKTGKPTFFENLLAQRQLTYGIFSVHMTRRQEYGSQVCFGCYDPRKVRGAVLPQFHPLVSRTYWAIGMDGLSVNNQTVPANLTAAIDTGTSLIYLPKSVADTFYAEIPGSSSATDFGEGYYSYPCDADVSVSLIFGGLSYAIHPADFSLGVSSYEPSVCIGGVVALGDNGIAEHLAIIGAEFLKSWYTVFDYSGQVGFAPSINNYA